MTKEKRILRMKYNVGFLKNLYTTMLRIRLCEESLVGPLLGGEVRCPVHLYSGEEAVAAGVCGALNTKDYVFGTHRSHGHYLAKGGGMREMIAEIYGKENGCSRGRGGSMHLVSPEHGMKGAAPIVAGTIALALGAALASSIRRDGRVTVSFFGDGATGEGILFESLNFAALKKLPMIFVCENNFYSTHLPIKETRPSVEIYKIADPFGIKSLRGDGNDVLKVYEAAKRSAKLCRSGKGPVFLEFLTYRLRGHVGADDNIQGGHTDIRPKKEVESWKKKDPIRRFERRLLNSGILDQKTVTLIRHRVEKEVKGAHKYGRESAYPGKEDLLKYVFKR